MNTDIVTNKRLPHLMASPAVIAGMISTALLLYWPVVINGFPPINFDTGAYLERWYSRSSSLDRPITYSVILGMFRQLPGGLWIISALQVMLASVLLWGVVSTVMPRPRFVQPSAVACSLIFALGPSVLYVGMLMPDFTFQCLPLALSIALTANLCWMAMAAVVLLIGIHFSSLPIALLSLGPVFCLLLHSRVGRRRLVYCIILMILGYACISAVNNAWNASSRLNSPSIMFLAGRLVQAGTLLPTIDSHCQHDRPSVDSTPTACEFAEALRAVRHGTTEDLLWQSRSPVNLYWPGWETNPKNFDSATKFLKPYVYEALSVNPMEFIRSGLSNVTSMAAGTYTLEGLGPYEAELVTGIREMGGATAAKYNSSLQANGTWPKPGFQELSAILIRIASCLAVAVVATVLTQGVRLRRVPNSSIAMAMIAPLLIGSFYISNLLVCGFLSSLPPRYVERVAVLPFIALIILPWHSWNRSSAILLLTFISIMSLASALQWHFGISLLTTGIGGLLFGYFIEISNPAIRHSTQIVGAELHNHKPDTPPT